MRILFVIPYFYPALAFGGPVISSYQIARGLVRRGHEVTVFTSDAMDAVHRIPASHEAFDGVSVYRFRNVSMYPVQRSKVFLTPGMWAGLSRLAGRFDLIHLHEYRTLQNVLAHHFAVKNGVPYVLQAHSGLPRAGRGLRKSVYDAGLGRLLLADCKLAIALTTAELQQYQNMGVPFRRIAVIPTGIELSQYRVPTESSFRKAYDLPEKAQIALYLGRLHWSKGLATLIAAQAWLVKRLKYRNSVLVLAGPDDGFLQELRRLARELGIQEFIRTTGFLSPQTKLEALREADFFVTPSYLGFPTAFLESLAMGTPIVTTTAGDELDWLSEVGIVSQPDPERLAEEMYKLFTDRPLRNRLSQSCAEIVRKFTMDRTVLALEQAYLRMAR